MPRWGVWGLSVVLVISGSAVAAADPPGRLPGQTTLVNKLNTMFSPQKAKPSIPATAANFTEPLSPEAKLDAIRAEQDAYLRRLSVCTELRRVALERGDLVLSRQVDELERQAAALYNTRVAGLGVSRAKAPLPEPTTATSLADFPPSTEPATTAAKADKLIAPAAPVPATTTVQVREVKP